MLRRISDKTEMAALVQRIMDANYTEEELDGLLELLVRSTAYADVSDLIFWPEEPMTAIEVVDTALSRRPIILGDTE